MKRQLADITGMTVDCAGRPWVAHFGGARTGAPFIWNPLRKTLEPSINGIATILLVLTVGISAVALRLARYRSWLCHTISLAGPSSLQVQPGAWDAPLPRVLLRREVEGWSPCRHAVDGG